jgi:hypothetical protein
VNYRIRLERVYNSVRYVEKNLFGPMIPKTRALALIAVLPRIARGERRGVICIVLYSIVLGANKCYSDSTSVNSAAI